MDISKIDLLKVKAPSGLTYAQELVNAANLLAQCIQSRIRQGSLQNSISTADMKIQNSLRPSLFKKWNQSDANVFWLLNDGYAVKKDVWFKNIPNFGYRAAAHFVEQGIRDFNGKNKLGIQVEVKRPLFYYGS